MFGNPADPAAFTDFDTDQKVEVVYKGQTYRAFRLPATMSFGSADEAALFPPPLLMYVSPPDDAIDSFGNCEPTDTRATVAARLLKFLEEHDG